MSKIHVAGELDRLKTSSMQLLVDFGEAATFIKCVGRHEQVQSHQPHLPSAHHLSKRYRRNTHGICSIARNISDFLHRQNRCVPMAAAAIHGGPQEKGAADVLFAILF